MEEYVHLKSLEDEIEYSESTMPKKEEEGVGDAARSPRVGDSNTTNENQASYPNDDNNDGHIDNPYLSDDYANAVASAMAAAEMVSPLQPSHGIDDVVDHEDSDSTYDIRQSRIRRGKPNNKSSMTKDIDDSSINPHLPMYSDEWNDSDDEDIDTNAKFDENPSKKFNAIPNLQLNFSNNSSVDSNSNLPTGLT